MIISFLLFFLDLCLANLNYRFIISLILPYFIIKITHRKNYNFDPSIFLCALFIVLEAFLRSDNYEISIILVLIARLSSKLISTELTSKKIACALILTIFLLSKLIIYSLLGYLEIFMWAKFKFFILEYFLNLLALIIILFFYKNNKSKSSIIF